MSGLIGGFAPVGGGAALGMDFDLTEIEVNSDGGEVLTISAGLSDADYYVDVGLVPAVESVRAYSARSGFGTECRSRDGLLTFTFPRVTPAEGYQLLITPVAGGASVSVDFLFNARRRPIFSATHALRRSLSPKWSMGATDPRDEVVA